MKDLKHLKRKADKILYQTLPSDMVKDIRDQKLVGQYFHRDIFNAVLGYRLENCKKDHMIINFLYQAFFKILICRVKFEIQIR